MISSLLCSSRLSNCSILTQGFSNFAKRLMSRLLTFVFRLFVIASHTRIDCTSWFTERIFYSNS